MEGLWMCDVNLDRREVCVYLDVFLAGRKTYQYNQGDRKSLMGIGGNLCPVRALIRRMEACNWDPKSKEKLPPSRTRADLTALMKIIASENDINPDRIGPHSLRSGWANAMFVAGYDTDVIQRWGRWKSASFATYLWNDDMVLSGAGRGMMLATGLLPQLKRQSGDDRNRKIQKNDDIEQGAKAIEKGQANACSEFLKSCRNYAATTREYIANGMVLWNWGRF